MLYDGQYFCFAVFAVQLSNIAYSHLLFYVDFIKIIGFNQK